MKRTSYILIALLYVMQTFIYLYVKDAGNEAEQNDNLIKYAMIFAGVTFILAIINIVSGFVRHKKVRENPEFAKSVSRRILIQKILLIGFYLYNFGIWFMITAALLVVPGLQFFLIIVPFGVMFTYVIMLSTSVPAISLLYADSKNGIYSKPQLVLGIISQLIFVLDIFGYMYLFMSRKKHLKMQDQNNIE